MAFGGYKFAGYRVDSSQYSTNIERCLAIHAVRVRAFLNASYAAGMPWDVDPDWCIGTIDINPTTGVIQSGTNCIIIEQIGIDNNVHGYLTCFKYSNGGVNGYYAIITTDNYNVKYSDDSATGLLFNPEECLRSKSNANYYFGPHYASCLHCLSLEEFGHAPSGETGKDYKYLITKNYKSMKIKSIGYNLKRDSSYSGNLAYGYVYLTTDIMHFGYVIKDKDIIVMSAKAAISSYTNPFTGSDNTHVTVMSLEGFSELYAKDDTYKFLEFEVKNGYYNSYNVGDETTSNRYYGLRGQFLNADGKAMIDNTDDYNYNPQPYVSLDIRASYDPNGANYVPFMGMPMLCDKEYISGTQWYKGTTNPELVATNYSSSDLVYTPYSPVVDGNMLFLYYFSSQQTLMPLWIPGNYGDQFTASYSITTGTYNVYMGWDSSNPDLKSDAAWPEYFPVVSGLV